MSEDNKDLTEGRADLGAKVVDAGASFLNKLRGGKTMQVIPPKGPTVNMPRGAKTTQVNPAPAVEPPKSSTAGKVAGNIAAGGATAVAGLAGAAMLSGGKKAETEKPTSSVSPAPQSSISPAPKPKQDDMTFGQAFKKAREMSGGKSTGQFTWHGKEYQTNTQGKGSATKPQEKYIAPKLQNKTGLDVPKTTTAAATTTTPAAAAAPKAPETPKPATTPETSTVTRTMPAQLGGKEPEKTTVATPQVSYERPQFPMSAKSSFEDGGKKKKMSEENNKLIDMFLKLQEKHALTPNIFEAAKKVGKMEEELKGNQHRIDANKNGKIDAHDFKLLRAKKNVKEGEGDETAKKETSMSVTMDNKPSTPAQTTAATSGPSAADKKALDTKIKSIAKEEVEFSQAEIDHINSFFEAVAPSRAEPTKGVNPTVRNTDLTDETLEEGRPRKNPTPETTERDARQHIQVQAGRAAGGTVVDFNHDNGKVSKLTPGMGRAITAHLNGLKPAERQEAVKRMHASPEGLKV
jgi:hypothetical protein